MQTLEAGCNPTTTASFSNAGSASWLPLVSVVIPAYRCSQYIAQAVESVLAQSYPEREIIVVNDGSPDTPVLEAELQPYRDQIRYIYQDTAGPSGARNRGILESSGKYVAFLDGDDYWAPEHLTKQMRLLQRNSRLELVYCDCALIKDEQYLTRSFTLQPQSSRVTFDTLLVEDCAIGTSTAVVSREAIIRAGLFDESFRRCEDFDMWLRMAFQGSVMAYHRDAEVFHRVWEQGLSADRLSMKRDRIRVYEKLAASLPVSPRQRSTLRKLAANTQRDCEVDILKQLLDAGDYDNALTMARRAQARSRSWKIQTTYLGLRFAPRVFGAAHRLRARLLAGTAPQFSADAVSADSAETASGDNEHGAAYRRPEQASSEQLQGISSGR